MSALLTRATVAPPLLAARTRLAATAVRVSVAEGFIKCETLGSVLFNTQQSTLLLLPLALQLVRSPLCCPAVLPLLHSNHKFVNFDTIPAATCLLLLYSHFFTSIYRKASAIFRKGSAIFVVASVVWPRRLFSSLPLLHFDSILATYLLYLRVCLYLSYLGPPCAPPAQ